MTTRTTKDIISGANLEYCASDMMLPKHKRIESKKIRDSARGQQCTVRLQGICNWNPETTVLAHFNGAGWALKEDDDEGAFACSSCHDELDRRTQTFEIEYVKSAFNDGVRRTRKYLKQIGLIIIK